MGKPRSTSAAKRLEDIEAVFSALAHPSRRQILLVLHFRGGELPAGDIASRFGCSWPTTTRHLGVLRAAGLIDVEQDGRQRLHRLKRDRLDEVVGEWLANFGPPPKAKRKRRRSR
ncbi:MAG: metalloregulator ArsR/SmtB family transcription factor [Planctomycetota bacterium]|nr:metalloregulator ArsR/SmtB family transcription factor [Planctomycetota bacterium]